MRETAEAVVEMLECIRQDIEANGPLALVYTASALEADHKRFTEQELTSNMPSCLTAGCNPLISYISQSAYRTYLKRQTPEVLGEQLGELQAHHLDEYQCLLFFVRQALLDIAHGTPRVEMIRRLCVLGQALFP